MSLATPEKLRKLQRALYAKAKREPEYRFYSLYDKVYREDVLSHAYALCEHNGGAPGVDGQTFRDIEAYGVDLWLRELGEEVRTGRYQAQAVRRKMIPKPGGAGERPLGIPTIRDRVVQKAVILVIEPVFEADFDEAAYGYRPGRSAQQAIRKVHETLLEGHIQVVDADLTQYFDSIPHEALMKCLARRIADGKLLHLIKMWLKAPVEEKDGEGRRTRTGGKGSSKGTPQGGVVSPLLANLYFHRFIKAFRKYGLDRKFEAVLVNYADDFVLLCRCGAKKALESTRKLMRAIGLELNARKTRTLNARRKRFDFLGYTFGPRYWWETGKPYLAAAPSKRAVARMREKVRRHLRPAQLAKWPEVAEGLNRMLRGWANYFSFGSAYQARACVDAYVAERVRHFLRRRSGSKKGRQMRKYGPARVFGELGVLSTRRLPCQRHAHAVV